MPLEDRIKQSTIYHRKRKGFCGKKRKIDEFVDLGNQQDGGDVLFLKEMYQMHRFSSQKLQSIDVSTPKQSEPLNGNQIIDIEILSKVFEMLNCPVCDRSHLKLNERMSMKKGLAYLLYVKCECGYSYDFYTSKSSAHNSYDINKGMVYTMRACGQGYAGLETFTAFMNMPKPMTANNYDKIVSQVTECVKSVAEQTIADAAEEIRNGQNPDSSETVIDTAISCDGSWQRRGYSSLNGVVTAISMQTVKILDCEPMSRICKSYNLHEKD